MKSIFLLLDIILRKYTPDPFVIAIILILIAIALPRVRDFRGVSDTAFDGHGNYSLGLTEQLVFPELNPDKYTRVQGMNIAIVTTSRNDEEALELLTRMGMPSLNVRSILSGSLGAFS